MMQFPASPAVGQTFSPTAGVVYRWSGLAWYLTTPGALSSSLLGQPNGVASLDSAGQVPASQLGNVSLANSLSGDVLLNNTANYFDGPQVAQGSVGTWLVMGSVSVTSGAAAQIRVKLWDGATVIASGVASVGAPNQFVCVSLSGVISTPAGNLKLSARDPNNPTGVMVYNQAGDSKEGTITAVRIG